MESDAFFIIGYKPSFAVHGGLGLILLAARKGDTLVYVGSVAIEFGDRSASVLRMALDQIEVAQPVVTVGRQKGVFVQPKLVAEVAFSSWTKDGKLRHASFKGLREGGDHESVFDMARSTRR